MERQDSQSPVFSPFQPVQVVMENANINPLMEHIPDSVLMTIAEKAKADSVIAITVAVRNTTCEINLAKLNCTDEQTLAVIKHLQASLTNKPTII